MVVLGISHILLGLYVITLVWFIVLVFRYHTFQQKQRLEELKQIARERQERAERKMEHFVMEQRLRAIEAEKAGANPGAVS